MKASKSAIAKNWEGFSEIGSEDVSYAFSYVSATRQAVDDKVMANSMSYWIGTEDCANTNNCKGPLQELALHT